MNTLAFSAPIFLLHAPKRQLSTLISRRTYIAPRAKALISAAPTRKKISIPVKPPPSKKARAKASLILEDDFLESTRTQQFQTYSFFGLTFLELFNLISQSPDSPLSVALPVLLGYIFADFATGVYHWGVDNYGSLKTPVLGKQIEAFQGHHSSPWTISQRAFANNLSALTVPTTPQLLVLLALSSFTDIIPVEISAFCASSLLFIVLSQEFHKQAHMIRSNRTVTFLQNLGIILPKYMHVRHHQEPHHANYCIVSGLCNRPLDHFKVFRRLEKVVFLLTGNQPNTWKLDPSIKEEAMRL